MLKLLLLYVRKRLPVLCLFVKLRYSVRAATGHILLIWPSGPNRVFISLVSILFFRPFLARKEVCGLMRSEFLSLKEQYSFSLTHACISLILQPVARRRRKAVFLRELVSEEVCEVSKSESTLFRLH